MDPFKIILFLCNWGPHAAYQSLQDQGADIPQAIKMIRIPCTGRISKSLLFKSFEMGADGVALVGCDPGSCRYGRGTESAIVNTEDTRDILKLLGLGKERLKLAMFQPDDAPGLLQFLKAFNNEIESLGHSPVTPGRREEVVEKQSVFEIIGNHDVYACQDCGKCSSACPLALSGKPFSPRAIASAIISGDTESPAVQEGIWSCLTCGLCYDRCPSAVNFPEFIQDIRFIFKSNGRSGHESHGGFFQSLMRTMTSPQLATQRWQTLPPDIQLDPESKILFFGGCAPYFDIFFKNHLRVQTGNIITDSLRLLNFFDIKPAILEKERCCGHDLLWTGDQKNFKKLAILNAQAIQANGVEEVITSCPECYRTLAHDYAGHGIKTSFKVTHMYDFLEKEISKGAVGFKKHPRKITFQDSCRLSRLENRPDLPRNLISRLKPEIFSEMQEMEGAAICCGNSGWTGCDAYSKALQVNRLKQARATNSDLLITSCPKCQIHLRCAMEDPFQKDEIQMDIMDLTGIIAKTIYWE